MKRTNPGYGKFGELGEVGANIYTKQITYHAPAPYRVILSEAAPLINIQAHPPIIAAQRTPP